MQDKRNLCYPFIHEDNWITDYEVLTDSFSSEIGFASSLQTDENIKFDLVKICELVLHLNPLIRKRDEAIATDVYNQLNDIYEKYNVEFKEFYLPVGSKESTSISVLRSSAKNAIRLMVKNECTSKTLLDSFNILANIFHLMFLRVENNKVEFKSRSY